MLLLAYRQEVMTPCMRFCPLACFPLKLAADLELDVAHWTRSYDHLCWAYLDQIAEPTSDVALSCPPYSQDALWGAPLRMCFVLQLHLIEGLLNTTHTAVSAYSNDSVVLFLQQ